LGLQSGSRSAGQFGPASGEGRCIEGFPKKGAVAAQGESERHRAKPVTTVRLVLASEIDAFVNLQVRGEFFNLMNHPNYSLIGRVVNDATFGIVQNQLSPRQIQMALKLSF
jgi:hypothetical protein